MSEHKRVIVPRKYITLELRGEEHRVFSLPAADLKLLTKTIDKFIAGLILQASALAQADWGIRPGKKRRGLPVQFNMPPEATRNLLRDMLESIIEDPLALLEAASGLPHKFFDVNDRENCLSIDELKAVAQAVIEVNGLDFLVAKVRRWWTETQRKNEERRQSAISAITSGYDRIAQALNTSNESSRTTSSRGFLRGLFARKKRRHMPPQS